MAVRTHRIISTFPQCDQGFRAGHTKTLRGNLRVYPAEENKKQKQKTAMRQLKIHQGTKCHRFIQFPSMSTGLQCPMWKLQVNTCLRYLHITYAYPAILLKSPLDYLQYLIQCKCSINSCLGDNHKRGSVHVQYRCEY